MDNCGIYLIYFDKLPDKCYIGRSTNLKVRFQEHKSALIANRHINYKLQECYNKYGLPIFEILEVCSEPDKLKQLEALYIQEFNSFKEGLNLTNGGENGGFGEGTPAAKHTENEYVAVLEYLANTNYTFSKICKLTGVSKDIIKHISSGVAHGYLQLKYPELYKVVESKRYKRTNSAKDRGIVYPELKCPLGKIHIVENLHEFCRQHNLQPQNLHKVLTKQRNIHKGWTLA